MAASVADFNVILGAEASAVADANFVGGYQASANARQVTIGHQASGFRDGVNAGYNNVTTAFSVVSFGRDNDDDGNQGVIMFGREVVATQTQAIFAGSPDHPIDDSFLGNGAEVASPDLPTDHRINASGVAAGETDTPGANIIIAAGIGTGNATGIGSVHLQFAPPADSSGSTRNALADGVIFRGGATTTSDDSTKTIITFTTQDDASYLVRVDGSGIRTDDFSEVGGYTRIATVKNDGGTVSIVPSVTAPHDGEDDADWNIGLSVSGANIRTRVTGVASTNIRWTALMTIVPNEG